MFESRNRRIRELKRKKNSILRGMDRDILSKTENGYKSNSGLLVVNGQISLSSVETIIKERERIKNREVKNILLEVAQDNIKELIQYSLHDKLNKLNRQDELSLLERNLLIYNAIVYANKNNGYDNLLLEYKLKINSSKEVSVSLERLYKKGYLLEEDKSSFYDILSIPKEVAKNNCKRKIKVILESKDKTIIPPIEVSKKPIELVDYDIKMVEIILDGGFRIKSRDKFIGDNVLPYNHVWSNASKRYSGIDKYEFTKEFNKLLRDNIVIKGSSRTFSFNPHYSKECTKTSLVDYVKSILQV